jgi:micrococcal nuclease
MFADDDKPVAGQVAKGERKTCGRRATPARVAFAFLAPFVLGVTSLAHAQTGDPCAPMETRHARLSDVDDRLELTLEDGAKLRLFGVEAPFQSDASRVAGDVRAWLSGRDLVVELLSATVDRWGRRPARVRAAMAGSDQILSVADALIDGGRARVRVEPGPIACLAPLFALENEARLARLGLWANPANLTILATRREAFAGHAGQSVIVEGRVTGVGETATRLYLNYGPIRTVDFSLTFTKASLKTLAAAGVDPRAMAGVMTRVRGQLDRRFGPQIEVVHPASIEIMK